MAPALLAASASCVLGPSRLGLSAGVSAQEQHRDGGACGRDEARGHDEDQEQVRDLARGARRSRRGGRHERLGGGRVRLGRRGERGHHRRGSGRGEVLERGQGAARERRALARVELADNRLILSTPLRAPRSIDLRQLVSYERSGRIGHSLILRYRPADEQGRQDVDNEQFLGLPPLDRQFELEERLDAAIQS